MEEIENDIRLKRQSTVAAYQTDDQHMRKEGRRSERQGKSNSSKIQVRDNDGQYNFSNENLREGSQTKKGMEETAAELLAKIFGSNEKAPDLS